MLQQKTWCFHNLILLVVGERLEIGMEASKIESRYVLRACFDVVVMISMWYGDGAVYVGAVGKVINYNRRMTSKCKVRG
jgi:hypothetical protein